MIDKNQFGKMPDGQLVDSYILTNNNGMSVEILTLGAIIRSWRLASDPSIDIVLGFDTVMDYLSDQSYLGRTVGRYANRIKNGEFKIAENNYSVSTNLQGNCLHGGVDGFHNRLWSVTNTEDSLHPSISLSLTSDDGDQGFPGTLKVDVIFSLDQEDRLTIEYRAVCNQDTVFNPTQHSYFNLAGHDSGCIFDQQIQLSANFYTPADDTGIPTGEIKSVDNSAFDLRQPTSFAEAIQQQDKAIKAANGLDHNWCVDGFTPSQEKLQWVANVTEPMSGRVLVTETTMPGAQVYTGNFLGENPVGKNNTKYACYHGFCIESQFYPNSPNQAEFPSATLLANTPFVSRTSYQIKQKSQQ